MHILWHLVVYTKGALRVVTENGSPRVDSHKYRVKWPNITIKWVIIGCIYMRNINRNGSGSLILYKSIFFHGNKSKLKVKTKQIYSLQTSFFNFQEYWNTEILNWDFKTKQKKTMVCSPHERGTVTWQKVDSGGEMFVIISSKYVLTCLQKSS